MAHAAGTPEKPQKSVTIIELLDCIDVDCPTVSSVSQTVLVIGALLEQMSPNSHPGRSRTQVIAQLVGLLQNGSIASTLSRASIYHLVGQYAEEGALDSFAPDVLRIAAKGFAEEVWQFYLP